MAVPLGGRLPRGTSFTDIAQLLIQTDAVEKGRRGDVGKNFSDSEPSVSALTGVQADAMQISVCSMQHHKLKPAVL